MSGTPSSKFGATMSSTSTVTSLPGPPSTGVIPLLRRSGSSSESFGSRIHPEIAERTVCKPADPRPLAPGEAVELTPRVSAGPWKARLQRDGKVLWKGPLKIESGGVCDVPIPAL